MAKKRKTPATAVQKKPVSKFDPEKSPYFVLKIFGVLLLAMVILYREFIFSDKIFHSPDMMRMGLFFKQYFVDYVLTHWSVPKWDPYIFGGMPFVDAFHSDLFYPPAFLKFFGSLFRMLSYNLLVHIFFSGVFTYLCARQFKLSKLAALLSGISYMFAGYLVSLMAPWHDGKIFVTSLFPLTILFVERGFAKKPFLNFSILGLVIGLIILTPHPQMAYFTLWAVALYTLFKLIVLFREKKTINAIIKPSALTIYAVVIGLLISAIQFYPGYYYTSNYSPRSETKRGWDWATSWSLHEEETFSLLIPEFAGTNSQKAKTYYWGKNPFKDNSETVEIVCLFAALIGFLFYRKKESYFMGGLALFALIYALGATTPFFRIFFHLVPMVKSLRAPSMIMFLFSFSIAILAGMGLQFIIDRSRDLRGATAKRFKYVLFGLPALMLLFAFLFSGGGKGMLNLWTSIFYSDAPASMVQQGVSKLDVAYMNLPAIQSGAWFAFLFTALAAACIWAYQTGKMGIYILIALLFIPVVDSIRFNSRFIKLVDPKPYLSNNALTEYFQKDNSKYRVQNFAPSMTVLPLHGVEEVVGYHGNQLKWYDQLLGGPSLKNQGNPRLLNLVGTKYIIIPQNQKLPPDYFGEKPATLAINTNQGAVFHNPNAFPRVFLVDEYKVFDSLEIIQSLVIDGPDDLREVVYLEENRGVELSYDTLNNDSCWIIDHAAESVLIGLNCTKDHILVITDNYYEAWKAYIDGASAKIYRADGSFRAIVVPAGTKQVLFKYESSRYATGRLLTLLTSLFLLIVFGYYGYQWRRNRSRSGSL